MAGYLSTHVLDTSRGLPAKGIRVELYQVDGDQRVLLNSLVTNHDGRTDEQLLPEARFFFGSFELVFHTGEYFDSIGEPKDHCRFLDVIPIRFGMFERIHYHVPLLLSPYAYSTYRGS
ncbi:hydroxyisourate hydrolase [uncultured Ruegeria sp.]|uniref:hydroxyisourate hydrolase n=1 Tax=uncultured Ruegeria sp. TaxID=259304 RepID=UPI00261612E5|nr:hydroxyisourate hydrolase [uncultured Ruegeria sp.]